MRARARLAPSYICEPLAFRAIVSRIGARRQALRELSFDRAGRHLLEEDRTGGAGVANCGADRARHRIGRYAFAGDRRAEWLRAEAFANFDWGAIGAESRRREAMPPAADSTSSPNAGAAAGVSAMRHQSSTGTRIRLAYLREGVSTIGSFQDSSAVRVLTDGNGRASSKRRATVESGRVARVEGVEDAVTVRVVPAEMAGCRRTQLLRVIAHQTVDRGAVADLAIGVDAVRKTGLICDGTFARYILVGGA